MRGDTSLVAQWLKLCTFNAGGPGSIPGQGTISLMLQLRSGAAQKNSIKKKKKDEIYKPKSKMAFEHELPTC